MGFFDEAGIDVNDVPDDPYGFGNIHWPVFIAEVKEPAVTKNGDKYGMQIVWAVDDPQFEGQQVSKAMGFGNWMQLPPPEATGIPFNPKAKSEQGAKDRQVVFELGKLLKSLGFSADEMGSVGPKEMVGKRCAARINVKKNEKNYWEYSLFAFRELKDTDGSAGFSDDGESDSAEPAAQSAKSAAELLDEELNNA